MKERLSGFGLSRHVLAPAEAATMLGRFQHLPQTPTLPSLMPSAVAHRFKNTHIHWPVGPEVQKIALMAKKATDSVKTKSESARKIQESRVHSLLQCGSIIKFDTD